MANPTNETQKNLEIGKFKSPEELATALEQKSKNNIAEKIRKISWEVQWRSIDLRKELKEKLTPEEQNEIREALPDSWVEKVLDKKIEADIWEKALASAIWEENTKTLKKVEWIWDRVSTGFDKIWDIFENKWFIAWLWAIFLMFKWIFSWDFSGLDSILNPEKKEDEKKEDEKKENKPEVISNQEKIIWVILSRISWLNPNQRERIPSILNNKNISKRNFNFIKDYYENNKTKNWWAKDLQVSENYKDEEIKNSFKIIIEKENLIDDLLKIEHQNWREKSLWEIFVLISPSLSLLKNITEIKSLEDLKDKFNFWEITPLPWTKWLNLWDSEEKINKLKQTYKWLNTNTLYHLKTVDKDTKYTNFEYNWQEGINLTEEIEFMKTLKEYWPKIEKQLIDNFSLWLWGKIWDLLKNHPLTMSEIVDLFIITGWKVDWFNNLEKSYLYLKLIKIIDNSIRWDTNVLLWEYYSQLAKAVYDSWSDKEFIPKEVKDVISSIFWSISTIALNYIIWKFQILGWIMKDNPIQSALAAWAIIWLIMLLPKVWVIAATKTVIISSALSILITLWIIKANDSRIRSLEEELKNYKG